MIKDNVLRAFEKKNVLVTGGTGLIGRQVVRLLVDAGAKVSVVSLDKINLEHQCNYIYGDLTGFSFCKEITKDMDFVFHMAGIKGSIDVTINKPASHFVPALMFNTNVLEACRLNKVQKVVFTSSIGAYASAEVFREGENADGAPMDFYAGWAKRMAEFQIQAYKKQYGLNNFSVVRPCNVYGPGDNFDPENAMVIPSLMHRIANKENPVMVWGDGSAVRDFAYSLDVAEGVILALFYGTGEHPFINLASGKGVTIRQLVETLNEFLDFKYEFDTNKPSGFPKRVMDISLAQKFIEYHPTTTLKSGLEQTWQWYIASDDEYLLKKNYFKDMN
jgi:GDP-L-fucose synthase